MEKEDRWEKINPIIGVKDQLETNNLIQKNMVWWSAPAVAAMDIFKIQNVNVVQSAGALGSLKRKQNKIRLFQVVIDNSY